MVSLAIFAVITGFAIANYRQGGQGDELRLASQNAASIIRRAQTAALAGQTVFACSNSDQVCDPAASGACGAGTCGQRVPHGFGVRFSSAPGSERAAIFFADLNANRLYDNGETVLTASVSPTPNVNVMTVSPAAGSNLDIVFEPPKPKTYLNAVAPEPIAMITLAQSGTGLLKRVTVNKISGQISAE